MNMCVQIILCFVIYVSFYRIYSNSPAGTSFCCYNEDIDDTNETIELEHDIEGFEEIPSLPCDILEPIVSYSFWYMENWLFSKPSMAYL